MADAVSGKPLADKLYDLSKLHALSSGNDSFLQKMISLFSEQAPASVKEIKEAFLAEDYVKMKAVAHRMKPSIDHMGIIALKKDILEIETFSAENTGREELDRLVRKLDTIITQVVHQLQSENK